MSFTLEKLRDLALQQGEQLLGIYTQLRATQSERDSFRETFRRIAEVLGCQFFVTDEALVNGLRDIVAQRDKLKADLHRFNLLSTRCAVAEAELASMRADLCEIAEGTHCNVPDRAEAKRRIIALRAELDSLRDAWLDVTGQANSWPAGPDGDRMAQDWVRAQLAKPAQKDLLLAAEELLASHVVVTGHCGWRHEEFSKLAIGALRVAVQAAKEKAGEKPAGSPQ